jgi:membrane protein implicated in regulation of membrane protease activity
VDDAGVILLAAILVVIFVPMSTTATVVVLVVAGCLEVVEITILRRWSKRLDKKTKRTTGAEALIGEAAKVVEPCHPRGWVQLNGELWEAQCDEGAEPGDTVRVRSLDGLTLVVGH